MTGSEGRGRPSKLTPAVKETFVDAIRQGCFYVTACARAGIHYTTFRRWMQRGSKAMKGAYREFYNGVFQADADVEIKAVEAWVSYFPQDWRAVQRFLERRFPERWGRLRSVGGESA